MVLSDFLDKGGFEDGLRYLAARNLDVYAIQVLAQEEVEPPYTGDLKLTDVEDGDEAEVTISAPLLERYRQTLGAVPGVAERLLHPARDVVPVHDATRCRSSGWCWAICGRGGWCGSGERSSQRVRRAHVARCRLRD